METFNFENGHKLAAYENKQTDLYNTNDELIEDEKMEKRIFSRIKSDITGF